MNRLIATAFVFGMMVTGAQAIPMAPPAPATNSDVIEVAGGMRLQAGTAAPMAAAAATTPTRPRTPARAAGTPAPSAAAAPTARKLSSRDNTALRVADRKVRRFSLSSLRAQRLVRRRLSEGGSNPSSRSRGDNGLLRCARNDGEIATHTPLSSPRRRGSSTPRLLGSITDVSGILGGFNR